MKKLPRQPNKTESAKNVLTAGYSVNNSATTVKNMLKSMLSIL